jgi:hypothetical protein
MSHPGTYGRRTRTNSRFRLALAKVTRQTRQPKSTACTGGCLIESVSSLLEPSFLSYPTEAELLATIRRARDAYLGAERGRTLDVLYVLTNADAEWFAEFDAAAVADGWTTVVSSSDLVLDDEQTDVGMVVDMEIARRAAVFIGNGVRAHRAGPR